MISWNCHSLAAEICHRHRPRWKIYSLVLGRKYVCQGLVIWELLYMHTYYRLCFKWKRLTQKQCDPRSTIEKTASENFPHTKMEKVSFLGAKFIFGASMDVLFCRTTCNMYLQSSFTNLHTKLLMWPCTYLTHKKKLFAFFVLFRQVSDNKTFLWLYNQVIQECDT